MPISGMGWELHINRYRCDSYNTKHRTIGSYQVYHDGDPVSGLSGTTVEAIGPGDNSQEDNGRRVEEGQYPIATQDGAHYVTIGYKVSHDWHDVPKPGIELLNTGNRQEILVHPGHDFLASVGCINLTDDLGKTESINFDDSVSRVIAIINDLKAYCGQGFPKANGKHIPNASVVIDGEPL